jgi:hypothetical protein
MFKRSWFNMAEDKREQIHKITNVKIESKTLKDVISFLKRQVPDTGNPKVLSVITSVQVECKTVTDAISFLKREVTSTDKLQILSVNVEATWEDWEWSSIDE